MRLAPDLGDQADISNVGAAYLTWMGVKIIVDDQVTAMTHDQRLQKSTRRAFADSIAVELLNPKTALFYFTFLPQFTSLEAAWPIWAQIIILGLCSNAAFSLTDAICIIFSYRLVAWAATSRQLARLGKRIGGSVFIAMGFSIAVRSD